GPRGAWERDGRPGDVAGRWLVGRRFPGWHAPVIEFERVRATPGSGYCLVWPFYLSGCSGFAVAIVARVLVSHPLRNIKKVIRTRLATVTRRGASDGHTRPWKFGVAREAPSRSMHQSHG